MLEEMVFADSKIVVFFREARIELKKVVWPTKQQLINHTVIVISVCVALAIFLGALDILFSWLLQKVI